MRKFLLIASVAAMAVTAPAQAQRDDRGSRGARAQQSEDGRAAAKARASRQQQASKARASRQQSASNRRAAQRQASERRQSRQQAVANRRAAQQQIQERRQSRQQAVANRRAAQQQAQERRQSRQQAVANRRAAQQQAQERRQSRQQAVADRRAAQQQARTDRRTRVQQIQAQRRARADQVQPDRRSQQRQIAERRSRIQQAQADRGARFRPLEERRARSEQVEQRRAQLQRMQAERRKAFAGNDRQYRQQVWQSRIERQRALARLRDRRADRLADDDSRRVRNYFRVGQRVDRNWWYDDYVPLRYRTSFIDNDRYYYRYDGDYLYRLRDRDNVVLSLFPLLGGAYSVGNRLPFYQSSYYNVPYGYSSLYYDTPSSYYRYGDSAIYRVDPTTQLIAGVVALLTGQSFGIGQPLPIGYDVYNVPYAYRSSYYDTDDMWYRYDDGYIYGVDPRTRLIQSSYPIYSGYGVGQPWPSYAGYDYGVPDYYGDLYYQQPNYDYRFASGGIYQVDPTTQLVTALVALVTGQNFSVGQPLPLGYDVYNVPFAYRDDYYDDDDNWYRYADGRIYQVDPGTRLIRRVIMV